MTIAEIQQEIIEDFSQFDDWMDKYEYLIDLGKDMTPINESIKRDEFLIKGCQSRVWLIPEYNNGIISFTADSDAIITKGIISLLLKVFSRRSKDEILGASMDFIDKIGLKQHLSPTRSNGLASMIDQIMEYARNCK